MGGQGFKGLLDLDSICVLNFVLYSLSIGNFPTGNKAHCSLSKFPPSKFMRNGKGLVCTGSERHTRYRAITSRDA